MASKDDLAALGLDEDEIELIRSRRKQRQEESDREVRIKTADGHEAVLPFGQARNWLRKVGILLEDEEPGHAEEEPPADEEPPAEEGTRRFGRRVS